MFDTEMVRVIWWLLTWLLLIGWALLMVLS
jgi:hypothetical protein